MTSFAQEIPSIARYARSLGMTGKEDKGGVRRVAGVSSGMTGTIEAWGIHTVETATMPRSTRAWADRTEGTGRRDARKGPPGAEGSRKARTERPVPPSKTAGHARGPPAQGFAHCREMFGVRVQDG